MRKFLGLVSVALMVYVGLCFADTQWTGNENTTDPISRNGNIGVGTSTPSEKLDVNGNIKITGNGLFPTGSLGLGTSTPTVRLDVVGSAKVSANLNVSAALTANYATINSDLLVDGSVVVGDLRLSNSQSGSIYLGNNTTACTPLMNFKFGPSTQTDYNMRIINDADGQLRVMGTGANKFIVDGKVGIGTTVPSEKLDVNGNIKATGNITGQGITATGSIAATGSITTATNLNVGAQLTTNYAIVNLDLLVDRSVVVGTGNVRLSNSSGGAISLGDYNATDSKPYIDFMYGTLVSTDYNMRIANDADGQLHVMGIGANKFIVDGKIGIGTMAPVEKLDVNGNIRVNGTIKTKEVIVTLDGWSDFVFAEGYRLRTLNEVEQYIKINKHLPDVPSEEDVKVKGVSMGEMQSKLLQKVEELTLYVIELKKENQKLQDRVTALESK